MCSISVTGPRSHHLPHTNHPAPSYPGNNGTNTQPRGSMSTTTHISTRLLPYFCFYPPRVHCSQPGMVQSRYLIISTQYIQHPDTDTICDPPPILHCDGAQYQIYDNISVFVCLQHLDISEIYLQYLLCSVRSDLQFYIKARYIYIQYF